MLFKKKEYWLVIDFLTGEGKHTFETLYHFTPCEVQKKENGLSVQTNFEDDKNIKLTSIATVPMKMEIIKGQENSEQGWISVHSVGRVAAPTAIFSGNGKLPILIATIIQPFQNSAGSDIEMKIVKSPSFQANIVVQSGLGEDFWIVNLDNENRIIVEKLNKAACVEFSRKLNGVKQEGFTGKFSEY